MKTKKSTLNKLSVLLMAVVLICTLLPVQANAAVRNDIPVICASVDSAGEVNTMQAGIPVLSDDEMVMVTADDFYIGEYDYVTLMNEDDLVELNYSGSVDSLALFSFSYSDRSACVLEAQAVIGEPVVLQIMNKDAEIMSFDAVVTGSKSGTTSAGFTVLNVEIDGSLGSNYVLPGALLNKSGELVAVLCDEGYLGFAEPASGTGHNPDDDDDPETPTRQHGGDEPTGETAGGDEPVYKKYLIPIVGGVALVVLAVVVILVVRKPKPSVPPQPPIPPQPPQPPYPPIQPDPWQATQPGDKTVVGPTGPGVRSDDLWETVPETEPDTGMCLVDTSGLLGGRTFPIRRSGMLIGRAVNADIQYDKDTKGVSRNHCRIYVQGSSLMLVDNNSTSGTYLLGKGQLRAETPTEIRDGDVICLGSKKISLTVRRK